jgi:hypothetical protein
MIRKFLIWLGIIKEPEELLKEIDKEIEETARARKNVDSDIAAGVERARLEEEEAARNKERKLQLCLNGTSDLEKALFEIWKCRGPHSDRKSATKCLKAIKLFFCKWQIDSLSQTAQKGLWGCGIDDFIILSKIKREEPPWQTELMVDFREFNYKALGKVKKKSVISLVEYDEENTAESVLREFEAGINVSDYKVDLDSGPFDDASEIESDFGATDGYNRQFVKPIGPCGHSKQRLLLKCDDKIDWLLDAIIACRTMADKKEWAKIENGMIKFVS